MYSTIKILSVVATLLIILGGVFIINEYKGKPLFKLPNFGCLVTFTGIGVFFACIVYLIVLIIKSI